MDIDTEALARELVRALRGARSQRAVSRHMQYTTNVVYLWESGRRYPTGAAALWLAHRTGVDVVAAMRRLAPGDDWLDGLEPWSPAAVAAFLRALKGDQSAAELSTRVGRNRYAVGRWLKGQAEPRLPELLELIEAASARLLDFVAALTDPSALPSVAAAWARLEAARRLTRERPWAPAVLLALELVDVQRHGGPIEPALADRLGLPEAEVHACLALLAEAGQVRRDGDGWRRVEVQAVDTRGAAPAQELKRWWGRVALDRLGAADGVASFNLFTVSQADFERLQELHRAYYRTLRALVAASTPGERVVLANLHLLALDRPIDATGPIRS